MLTALILASKLVTVTLEPTDDIWVYPHASEQVEDTFLRVWGSDGQAVQEPDPGMSASWSLVKFDLGEVKQDGKLTKAVLVLTHAPKVGVTVKESADAPIEARAVEAGFTERLWDFREAEKFSPEGKANEILGTGAIQAVVEGKPTLIEVDLMKGPAPFATLLKSKLGSTDKKLAMALTSKIDPEGSNNARIYKFYSRAAEKVELRPKLMLTFSPE
ncbi:MAG: hypothetical protein JSS65_03310 [Armatimonadetes bacterium]|nr:hypothetical protein [Armatimonadota bacterium]